MRCTVRYDVTCCVEFFHGERMPCKRSVFLGGVNECSERFLVRRHVRNVIAEIIDETQESLKVFLGARKGEFKYLLALLIAEGDAFCGDYVSYVFDGSQPEAAFLGLSVTLCSRRRVKTVSRFRTNSSSSLPKTKMSSM